MENQEYDKDVEELTEEEIQEGIEELTEEEAEETTGGAGGYGNVQFVCECGHSYLTEKKLAAHIRETAHRRAKVYKQNAKGKGHRGEYIGMTKVHFSFNDPRQNFYILYPNDKTSGWYKGKKHLGK